MSPAFEYVLQEIRNAAQKILTRDDEMEYAYNLREYFITVSKVFGEEETLKAMSILAKEIDAKRMLPHVDVKGRLTLMASSRK
jgi:hypothetical protein